MAAYSIHIELTTDKEMSEVEKDSLIDRIYLELIEPEVRVEDETDLSCFEDASWSSVGQPVIKIEQKEK